MHFPRAAETFSLCCGVRGARQECCARAVAAAMIDAVRGGDHRYCDDIPAHRLPGWMKKKKKWNQRKTSDVREKKEDLWADMVAEEDKFEE